MSAAGYFRRAAARLQAFRRRPWHDQALFLQAFVLLGLTRLAILTIRFERLAGYFGPLKAETPQEATPEDLRQAARVGWAVREASRFTPWTSNCFPQALSAKLLLRWRGIPSTLYLGAAFKTRTEMEAHAWLRCGRVLVTGGAGHQRFGVVGIFG